MILSTWPDRFPRKHQGTQFKKDIENSDVSNVEYTRVQRMWFLEKYKKISFGFLPFYVLGDSLVCVGEITGPRGGGTSIRFFSVFYPAQSGNEYGTEISNEK